MRRRLTFEIIADSEDPKRLFSERYRVTMGFTQESGTMVWSVGTGDPIQYQMAARTRADIHNRLNYGFACQV